MQFKVEPLTLRNGQTVEIYELKYTCKGEREKVPEGKNLDDIILKLADQCGLTISKEEKKKAEKEAKSKPKKK